MAILFEAAYGVLEKVILRWMPYIYQYIHLSIIYWIFREKGYCR